MNADPPAVHYGLEPDLTPAEFADVLVRSTLDVRRPVDNLDRLSRMLSQADLIVTARIEGGQLVGVSRALSDFAWCTYLADLAVDEAWQRRGIGKELVRRTHEAAGRNTMLILLAAPAAREYYPKIGMTGHDSCWIFHRRD